MRTIILVAFTGLLTGSILGQCSIFAFLGAAIGLAFGAGLACALADLVPLREATCGRATLVAMNRSDGVIGAFLFGSGTINSKSCYNFMQRLPNGSMVPHSVPINRLVHLIEDASLTNTGYWSTIQVEPDTTSAVYKWAIVTSERTKIIRHEFHVPAGTVTHQFTV